MGLFSGHKFVFKLHSQTINATKQTTTILQEIYQADKAPEIVLKKGLHIMHTDHVPLHKGMYEDYAFYV